MGASPSPLWHSREFLILACQGRETRHYRFAAWLTQLAQANILATPFCQEITPCNLRVLQRFRVLQHRLGRNCNKHRFLTPLLMECVVFLTVD